MNSLKSTIVNGIRNKVFLFILSRYFTYFIQFINSLFIAAFLGPFYMGIWGFITLIIQYLNQINFGIAHSVNTLISIHKHKRWYVQVVVNTSITMLIILSVFVFVIFIVNGVLDINIGEKYNFSEFAPIVAFIGILGYFNTLFNNVFRVYGRLFEIAFSQTIFPVLVAIVLIFFKGKELLWAIVVVNLISFLLSFGLYIIRCPIKIKPVLIWRLAKSIQIKGWHLFVYNTSFYLIIISTKSFISKFYPVEEFGYFSFAFALANVVLLLLQSFSYLIYPKLINRLANANPERVNEVLRMVRDAYITTSHLLVHLAVLLFPLLMLFFPQYDQSEKAFRLIALTVVLYTNTFGYSGLLISKGHEKKLGFIALFSLMLNIGIAYVLIRYFKVTFEYVIISTMITYFTYMHLLGKFGNRILGINHTRIQFFNSIFPIKLLIPYLISIVVSLLDCSDIWFLMPFSFYVFLNYKKVIELKEFYRSILSNPNIINV
jgi:O-antigen/teichoic acid export membrane protein